MPSDNPSPNVNPPARIVISLEIPDAAWLSPGLAAIVEALRQLSLPAAPAAPDARGEPPRRHHSDDFRSFTCEKGTFAFNPTQGRVCARLYQALLNGNPELTEEQLLAAADSGGDSLAKLFVVRGVKHPAWETLIVRAAPRTYRLNLDPPAGAG